MLDNGARYRAIVGILNCSKNIYINNINVWNHWITFYLINNVVTVCYIILSLSVCVFSVPLPIKTKRTSCEVPVFIYQYQYFNLDKPEHLVRSSSTKHLFRHYSELQSQYSRQKSISVNSTTEVVTSNNNLT